MKKSGLEELNDKELNIFSFIVYFTANNYEKNEIVLPEICHPLLNLKGENFILTKEKTY